MLNKALFFYLSVGATEKIKVSSFEGLELLSDLYRLQLYVNTSTLTKDYSNLLSTACCFKIEDEKGNVIRQFHGLLSSMTLMGCTAGSKLLKFTLVPHLSLLDSTSENATFLDMTTTALFQKLLNKTQHELRLKSSYSPESIFFQYEQTPLAFLTRVMAREGVYFYFEQENAAEKLILVDDKGCHPIEKTALTVAKSKANNHKISEHAVDHLVKMHKMLPKSVQVLGYSTETGKKPMATFGNREVVSYKYYTELANSDASAKKYAEIFAEYFQSQSNLYQGQSRIPTLKVGSVYKIFEGNKKFSLLITGLHHKGGYKKGDKWSNEGAGFYSNQFRAIDSSLQFRPDPFVTHAITGVLPAEVVERKISSSAQIGQYKVRFAIAGQCESNWLSLAQYTNHSDTGLSFNLKPGTKVLVRFYQGIPDLPYIQGCLPHEDNAKLVTSENIYQHRLKTAGSEITLSDGPNPNILLSAGGSNMVLDNTTGITKVNTEVVMTTVFGAKEKISIGQVEACASMQTFNCFGPQIFISFGGQLDTSTGPSYQYFSSNNFYLTGIEYFYGKYNNTYQLVSTEIIQDKEEDNEEENEVTDTKTKITGDNALKAGSENSIVMNLQQQISILQREQEELKAQIKADHVSSGVHRRNTEHYLARCQGSDVCGDVVTNYGRAHIGRRGSILDGNYTWDNFDLHEPADTRENGI